MMSQRQWAAVRIRPDLHERLRQRAAEQTAKLKRPVSVVEVLNGLLETELTEKTP